MQRKKLTALEAAPEAAELADSAAELAAPEADSVADEAAEPALSVAEEAALPALSVALAPLSLAEAAAPPTAVYRVDWPVVVA